jgi:SAM-dependent methyltransferase
MQPARKASQLPLDAAIREMLQYFSDNAWFIDDYWPENEPRVTKLLRDLKRWMPAPGSVFEPGCGNGYISFLASCLGYQVTASDSWEPSDREELFRRANIRNFKSNLNDLDPWPGLSDGSMDAVVFGEVFEHLLNHPVGLLKQIHRLLRPGGLLLMTTPNPSTLVNAVRVLLDRNSMWGTDDFACDPKFLGGAIIDKGEIHYREYSSSELRKFLTLAGFQVNVAGYVGSGSPPHGPLAKRFAKKLLELTGLTEARLFSTSNYIVAIKK